MADEQDASRGQQTVLVLEKHDSLRSLICDALFQHGFSTLKASSGSEAINIGRGYFWPIHLLVVDLALPGMGGQDVAKLLQIVHPRMKVLCISTQKEDDLARSGVLDQTDGFLSKPFSVTELMRQFSKILADPSHE